MVLLDNGGRRGSELDLFAPPDDLAGVVEHLWTQPGHGAVMDDWLVVADASPHLVASVTVRRGRRAIRVALVGARSHAAAIDVADRVLTVGARLCPGALAVLTGESAKDFVDRSIAVETVFRSDVLSELELGADAPVSLLLHELVRLLRRANRRRAVAMLDVEWPPLQKRVRELAARLGTPTRSLRDRAHREIGLSPKRILRVLRLHAALHAARRTGGSWSQIAYAAGYADQAHLTRELRELLGETPSAWRARGSAVSFKTADRVRG